MPTVTYCRTLYGKVKGQPGYDIACDINQDGRIDLDDIMLLTPGWYYAGTIEYHFYRIGASAEHLRKQFLKAAQQAIEDAGTADVDMARNPKLSFVAHPGIWKVSVEIWELRPGVGAFPPLAVVAGIILGLIAGGVIAWIVFIEVKLKPIRAAAERTAEELDKVRASLEELDAELDEAYQAAEVTDAAYTKLKDLVDQAVEHTDLAIDSNQDILDLSADPFEGLGDIMKMMPMLLMLVVVVAVIGAVKK